MARALVVAEAGAGRIVVGNLYERAVDEPAAPLRLRRNVGERVLRDDLLDPRVIGRHRLRLGDQGGTGRRRRGRNRTGGTTLMGAGRAAFVLTAAVGQQPVALFAALHSLIAITGENERAITSDRRRRRDCHATGQPQKSGGRD